MVLWRRKVVASQTELFPLLQEDLDTILVAAVSRLVVRNGIMSVDDLDAIAKFHVPAARAFVDPVFTLDDEVWNLPLVSKAVGRQYPPSVLGRNDSIGADGESVTNATAELEMEDVHGGCGVGLYWAWHFVHPLPKIRFAFSVIPTVGSSSGSCRTLESKDGPDQRDRPIHPF